MKEKVSSAQFELKEWRLNQVLIIEDIVLVAPGSQIYVGDELRKDEIIRVTDPDDSGVFIS